MPIAPSVTLQCSGCGRTFQKPRSTLQGHGLAACPHCAMLQAPRQAHETGPLRPLAASTAQTSRK